MKNRTKYLKKEIQNLNSIEERLQVLKDEYKRETAYVVTCGPSLKTYAEDELKGFLKNKLVISLKQSYDVVGDVTDFHILNTYNFKEYNWNENTIVSWNIAKSYATEQLDRIVNGDSSRGFKGGYPIDLYVPIINPPYITRETSTAATRNFDNFLKLSTDTEIPWGPGTMYELGFALPIHLGCNHIVTIGWDIGDPNKPWIDGDKHQHFYDKVPETIPDRGEIKEAVESTSELYEWFKDKGIKLSIISDINPADERIDRIRLKEEIIND